MSSKNVSHFVTQFMKDLKNFLLLWIEIFISFRQCSMFESKSEDDSALSRSFSLSFELIFIKIRLFHSGFDFDLEWRDVSLPCSPLFRRLKNVKITTLKMFNFTNFWFRDTVSSFHMDGRFWTWSGLGEAPWHECWPFDLDFAC